MGGKEEAREGGWSKGERRREEGRKVGREGGRWEGGRPYMCKHVAGKIVKQYYRHCIPVSANQWLGIPLCPAHQLHWAIKSM